MKLTESLILAGALLVAAPALAQDNADMNAAVNSPATVDANAVAPLDMNTAENMPVAAPSQAVPVQSTQPAPRGFPFGVLGLLGLIGLFGVRKVKG